MHINLLLFLPDATVGLFPGLGDGRFLIELGLVGQSTAPGLLDFEIIPN